MPLFSNTSKGGNGKLMAKLTIQLQKDGNTFKPAKKVNTVKKTREVSTTTLSASLKKALPLVLPSPNRSSQ